MLRWIRAFYLRYMEGAAAAGRPAVIEPAFKLPSTASLDELSELASTKIMQCMQQRALRMMGSASGGDGGHVDSEAPQALTHDELLSAYLQFAERVRTLAGRIKAEAAGKDVGPAQREPAHAAGEPQA